MAKRKKARPKRRLKTSTILYTIGATALATLAVLVGFLAFTGGGDGFRNPNDPQDPVTTDDVHVTVGVYDNDYEPRDLTVRAGATVTWKFRGDAAHTVTEDQRVFDSGVLGRGDAFELKLDRPGEYFYFCTLHHAMQGKVTVVE